MNESRVILDLILKKLERVEEHVGEISVTMGVQAEQLKEHMRRTDLLEAKLKPVEAHVAQITAWAKLTKIVGGIIVAIVGLAAAMSKFLLGTT